MSVKASPEQFWYLIMITIDVLGSLCCVPVLFMCHYDQIRFPGIPVRRCRFSGIGVDGNAFHRLKTCHKSSYLSHLSSKQLFLIDTYCLQADTVHHRTFTFTHWFSFAVYLFDLNLGNTFLPTCPTVVWYDKALLL